MAKSNWVNAVIGQHGERAVATPDVDMRTFKRIKPRPQDKNSAYVLTDKNRRIYVWDEKVLNQLNTLSVGTQVRVKTAYEYCHFVLLGIEVRLCHVVTALEVGECSPSQ